MRLELELIELIKLELYLKRLGKNNCKLQCQHSDMSLI